MDCIDLDKLGGAAPAPKWLAANDNIYLTLPPTRRRRSSRAKLELLN